MGGCRMFVGYLVDYKDLQWCKSPKLKENGEMEIRVGFTELSWTLTPCNRAIEMPKINGSQNSEMQTSHKLSPCSSSQSFVSLTEMAQGIFKYMQWKVSLFGPIKVYYRLDIDNYYNGLSF